MTTPSATDRGIIDADQARQQLHALFDYADGWLALSYQFKGREGAPFTDWFVLPDGIDDAADRARDLATDGAHVWFRVSPVGVRPKSGRGKKQDTSAIVALFADIDLHAPGIHENNGKTLPPDAGMALRIIADAMPYKPGVLVHSGYGLHVYYLLTEPFDLTDSPESRMRGERLVQRFKATVMRAFERAGYHVDGGTFELARILRVAGTINYKGDAEKPVELIHCDETQRHDIDTIEGALVELKAETPKAATDRLPLPHDADQDALRAMNRIRIQDGNDGSRRLYTAACRALEHGLGDDEALRTIRAYETQRPFPRAYSDGEVFQRISDAHGAVEVGSAYRANTPKPIDNISGPQGVTMKPVSARKVGASGKIEIVFNVAVNGESQAPLTITTSTYGQREAARTLAGWVGVARGADFDKAEHVAMQQHIAKVMASAETILAEVEANREADQGDEGGETMEGIIVSNAADLWGLAFRNDDDTCWSELLGRAVHRREFCDSPPSELIALCREAIDFPQTRKRASAPVGQMRQWFAVAWADAVRRLPGEVGASLGAESKAAGRYQQAVIDLFNQRELWQKTYARDGERTGDDSATLAHMASSVIERSSIDKPSGWRPIHNEAVAAWLFTNPVIGEDGKPTGEPPTVWFAVRYELANQFKNYRAKLPNTSTQGDFARLCHRYGLTAEGPDAPTQFIERGGKRCRAVVLNQTITRLILADPDAEDEVSATSF